MELLKRAIICGILATVLITIVPSLQSCSNHSINREAILGAWKVDSTFAYYNGFGYTQREEGGSDWATYVYGDNGTMREIKYGSFQTYRYHIQKKNDTLVLQPTQGEENVEFAILELTKDRLVLKKDKRHLFPGANQKRYEIRYFSRSKISQDSLVPFKDPRKVPK